MIDTDSCMKTLSINATTHFLVCVKRHGGNDEGYIECIFISIAPALFIDVGELNRNEKFAKVHRKKLVCIISNELGFRCGFADFFCIKNSSLCSYAGCMPLFHSAGVDTHEVILKLDVLLTSYVSIYSIESMSTFALHFRLAYKKMNFPSKIRISCFFLHEMDSYT